MQSIDSMVKEKRGLFKKNQIGRVGIFPYGALGDKRVRLRGVTLMRRMNEKAICEFIEDEPGEQICLSKDIISPKVFL